MTNRGEKNCKLIKSYNAVEGLGMIRGKDGMTRFVSENEFYEFKKEMLRIEARKEKIRKKRFIISTILHILLLISSTLILWLISILFIGIIPMV